MTLSELADKIESGEIISPMNLFTLLNVDPSTAIAKGWILPYGFPTNSIDSAVKLLGEVLPDWLMSITQHYDGKYTTYLTFDHGCNSGLEIYCAEASTPAAAIVAATLRALEVNKNDD